MLDETAAPLDPPPDHQGAPPVRTAKTWDGEPLALAEIQQETRAPAYPELMPEAPNGEGGPLALMGDPPGSTNTVFRHGVAIVSGDDVDPATRATADLLRAKGHDVLIVPLLPEGTSQEARDALMAAAVDQADAIAAIREPGPHATVAVDAAGAPLPPTVPQEPKVEVTKRLFLPISQVMRFFDPACRQGCREGAVTTPGSTTPRLCWCALKRCREAAQGVRNQARAQERAKHRPATPAALPVVREGSVEAILALAKQLADVEAELAVKERQHADEIAAEQAEALVGERHAGDAADKIADAEERLEAIAKHIEAAKRAQEDLEGKLANLRTLEADARAKIEKHRALAEELRHRTARGVSGLQTKAAKLRRRLNNKLAYQPGLDVQALLAEDATRSSAPAPVDAATPESPAAAPPNLCAHGQTIGDPCQGCENMEAARRVENGTEPPLETPAVALAANAQTIEAPFAALEQVLDPALPPAYLAPATPADPPPEVLSDAGAQG